MKEVLVKIKDKDQLSFKHESDTYTMDRSANGYFIRKNGVDFGFFHEFGQTVPRNSEERLKVKSRCRKWIECMNSNIKTGDTVKRKQSYYKGITGTIVYVKDGKAGVKWSSQTGSRRGNQLGTEVKLSSLVKI